ncbi:MAG: hypothetical protein V4594_16705 [Bacteroidota bacterium]
MKIKSWKTTAAAVALALVAAAAGLNWITAEQATAIGLALGAFGFAAAKDSNVTGGTTQQ